MKWVHRPAACQVEPLVSSSASSRVTSVQPSRVRWYSALQPAIPPPITATLVSARNELVPDIVAGQGDQYGPKNAVAILAAWVQRQRPADARRSPRLVNVAMQADPRLVARQGRSDRGASRVAEHDL